MRMEYFLLDTKEGKEKAILNIKNCPENYVCKIEPRNRTKEQNKFYWLLLSRISESVFPRDVKYVPEVWHEQFKRLFVPSKVEKLPDSSEIMFFKSTTKLNKSEFSNLIEEVRNFAVENGVEISDLFAEVPHDVSK